MTRATATRGAPWGTLSLIGAACAYGVATAVSVAALDHVRPFDLLAVELGGGSLALLGIGLANGKVRRSGAGRNLLIGALTPGLAFLLGDLGLSRTSASAGSLLLAAELPLTVLLSVLFLGERLRGWAWPALLLGLAGSGIVALGSGESGGAATTAGNALVVASVLATGAFVVLTRAYNGDDGFNASAWQTAGGAVFAAPFVLVSWSYGGSDLTSAGLEGWLSCFGVLATTAIGSVAFNWGISRVPAVTASQLLNLTPVVGFGTAVVVLGEVPSSAQYVGGVLVLLAVVLLVRLVEGAPSEQDDAGAGPVAGEPRRSAPPADRAA